MTNRAIPKITVRIDRGEDFVELCGDWQDMDANSCSQGDVEDWLDRDVLYEAYLKANEAILE